MSQASAVVIPMPRRPLVPNAVLGMVIFVVMEIMFFAGLFSAYMISEGMAAAGWPPPGEPRLPIEETAFNTFALLASGVCLVLSARALPRNALASKRLLIASIALGAFFVIFQGAEWVALISQGLTLTTSTHGSFFYLIVGAHALHAIIALAALGWALARTIKQTLPRAAFQAVRIFWYFVVAVWPILYWLVYL